MKRDLTKRYQPKKQTRPISQNTKKVKQRMSDIDWETIQRETGQLEPIEQ